MTTLRLHVIVPRAEDRRRLLHVPLQVSSAVIAGLEHPAHGVKFATVVHAFEGYANARVDELLPAVLEADSRKHSHESFAIHLQSAICKQVGRAKN